MNQHCRECNCILARYNYKIDQFGIFQITQKGTSTVTTGLLTIVAGLVPHVADALQTYVEDMRAGNTVKARAHIEGYLIAARNSGNLLDEHCERLLEEIGHDDGHFTIGVCFPTPLEPLNEGEASLYRWQYKIAGGFEKSLWAAILAADSTNFAAIEKGFPKHVEAFRRYTHDAGYWDALVLRGQKQ